MECPSKELGVYTVDNGKTVKTDKITVVFYHFLWMNWREGS